jgi:hypothetical protein
MIAVATQATTTSPCATSDSCTVRWRSRGSASDSPDAAGKQSPRGGRVSVDDAVAVPANTGVADEP